MDKIKLGITIGDINGVGPEVIIKALAHENVRKHIVPIIYGSSKVISYYKNVANLRDFSFSTISEASKSQYNKINVLNCWNDEVNITVGKATEEGGKYAYLALKRATDDLKTEQIDALVTAPINKEAMKMHGYEHPGHTEYITKEIGGTSLMMMVSDVMRVALVSNHLPVKDVASALTKETLKNKIKIFNKSLVRDFGIEKPIIAVLGLNPHAGDEGTIGIEEQEIIRPVIIEAKKAGLMVSGPYSADGFFGSSQFTKVDGILAMYHDQGLIPFKALSFGSGVNFTAGLSAVRTSPDHGTAYDIAGSDKASPNSFLQAIYSAIDITRSRKEYQESRANPLKKAEAQ